MAVKRGVIFDLGNTLVTYFTREQWPGVLEEGIAGVADFLAGRGLSRLEPEELARRVQGQRRTGGDQVLPLRGRLSRIFEVEPSDADLLDLMEEEFCKPVFGRARLCADSLEALAELRESGLRTAILSNTPWGSPGWLWRKHLSQLGLDRAVDVVAFCDDVGWRKPDRRAFEHVLGRLGLEPSQCLFVGDDPRWDIEGPRRVGMEAILIDRLGENAAVSGGKIASLVEVGQFLD
jgi:FMN phosphatase YigB (HAD superfamily)